MRRPVQVDNTDRNSLERASLRVGACQTPEILGDIEAALACIENFAVQAAARNVDLLLFPECFLQGYLVEEPHLHRHALGLDSPSFRAIANRLASIEATLVFGVIELGKGKLYNSAVVVNGGELLGVYRKTHLMAGEAPFTPGEDYPVFAINGITFGINICYDTRFAAAAAAVAAQGAHLLLVPAQNMMRRSRAQQWKHRHNQIRAERVRETGMWLASADVTGQRDGQRVGYGPTSIMNPNADVVAQVPLLTTGMVIADITTEATTTA